MEWSDSFSQACYRRNVKKLKDTSIFLVISQDCDISCKRDTLEPTVEIVVCKKIKEKDIEPRNLFVKSTRKLQFQVEGTWYEANSEYILSVNKEDLFYALKDERILLPSPDHIRTIPLWRANKYLRTALPDAFNQALDPLINKHIDSLVEAGASASDRSTSYIRSLYIWLDKFSEEKQYQFELFALLKPETPDEDLSNIQDVIEAICDDLCLQGLEDTSNGYVGREDSIYVSDIARMYRINLDSHSLSNRDPDVGPEETH
ncbi:MAG: hypothetical protein RPS47_07665 [Colwellia sp.]